MSDFKNICSNACNRTHVKCYLIDEYWICGHKCCIKTAIVCPWCIHCGEDKRNKINIKNNIYKYYNNENIKDGALIHHLKHSKKLSSAK